MKKTTLAIALMASMSSAQAASYDLTGTFSMYDPTGVYVGGDPAISGLLEMDMITGAGTADRIQPAVWWPNWFAHDVNIQMTSPDYASGTMLLDWGVATNIFITIDFDVTLYSDGNIGFTTIDGDGDGIIGNAMDNGPFPGFSPAFNMIASSTIPIPASVWLFGSGLLGLIGAAKRKKNA